MSSTDQSTPTVSIGLPVYNGARHIRCAIESVLAQDFKDFELIICDNASTDDTFEICQEYAERDSRIRLLRNEENLGAAPNFNKTFDLARGKYFKWLAYDDWIEPTYLTKCVEVLDTRPDVALVQSQTSIYSENGQIREQFEERLNGMDANPRRRFMSTLRDMVKVFQVFGVMRSNDARSTSMMGAIPGADHTFVAELSMIGKILMLPEYLHANRTTSSARDQRSWWDSSDRKYQRPKYTLLMIAHLRAIKLSKLNMIDKVILIMNTIRYFTHCRKFIVLRELKYLLMSRMSPVSRN